MLIFFYLIISFLIATSAQAGAFNDSGYSNPLTTILGFLGLIIFVWSTGFIVNHWIFKNIRSRKYKIVSMLKTGFLALIILCFLLTYTEFHWRFFIKSLTVGETSLLDIPVVNILLLILPAIIYYVAASHSMYVLENKTRKEKFSFKQYTDFYYRLLLMPLPLLILISAINDFLNFINTEYLIVDRIEFLSPPLLLVLIIIPVILIAIIFPIFIKFMLRSRVLPDSDLRQLLEETAKAAGVKFRNILVWKTGAMKLPNAMVVGFFAPVRYVFITDAILQEFSHEEIQSVFAHELGHAKKGHLLWYFSILMSYSFVNFLFLEPIIVKIGFALELPLTQIIEIRDISMTFLFVIVLVGLFSFVSKRFEKQADLFASKLIGANAFIDALYGISRVYGGGILNRPSITHGSLQSRINYIYTADYNLGIAEKFEKKMKIFFYAIGFVLLTCVVLTIVNIIQDTTKFGYKNKIFDAREIIIQSEEKGFLTKDDYAEIDALLTSAKLDGCPEALIAYIKALKLITEKDPENNQEILKLLSVAGADNNIDIYTRMLIYYNFNYFNDFSRK